MPRNLAPFRDDQDAFMAPTATLVPELIAPVPASATVEVLGIPLGLTDYEHALDWMDAAVEHRERVYVCVCNVHAVMAAAEDPDLRSALLGSDLNVPDGQPLVWAMNLLGHSPEARAHG